MARLRLRFLLQEFDLSGPEVLLGRGADCHITIEDPLVSRRHARIRLEGDSAWVSDLSSRNGIHVNGQLVTGETLLQDGDRIRLGTQDLVFSVASPCLQTTRVTGYLTMCTACGVPFPEEAAECPHCGYRLEDTVSGLVPLPMHRWTFELLREVIANAMSKQRFGDVHRLLTYLSREMDDQLAKGDGVQREHLDRLTELTLELSRLTCKGAWLAWAVRSYRVYAATPSQEIMQQLASEEVLAYPEVQLEVLSLRRWLQQSSKDLAAKKHLPI